jgi:2-amino-4-hydroxy-6-hydroxymethyldihydropteridine diphosphokinase
VNRVVVGVGSNVSPADNIAAAREHIMRDHRLAAESSFATTPPVGYADQPDFRNGAWLVETELPQPAFRRYLKQVEQRLGRERTRNTYGPRTIDLDVIAWNDTVVSDDYHRREFVRNAAREVAPRLPPHRTTTSEEEQDAV